MPNEYWSSSRSEASGTTIRSSVQTESKSSASARLVRSSSSLTVTLSRKFGKYRASFMRDSLLTVRQLGGQFVPVGWRRHLERVDYAGKEREVVRGRRQLNDPLLVVPLLQCVKRRLVDAIRAHELTYVRDDVALLVAKLARVSLRTQHVDHAFREPVASRRADLCRPHVHCFALAHRREDGDRAELRVDHALLAEEEHER